MFAAQRDGAREEFSPPPLTKMAAAPQRFERLTTDAVHFSPSLLSHQNALQFQVKTLAETRGVDPTTLTSSAWLLLTEELNFRLREVAILAAKYAQRHGRGTKLSTMDVNSALAALGHEVHMHFACS